MRPVPSFGQLIDEVVSTLSGHTADVPAMGTLVHPISPTDGTLQLDFGQGVGSARPNGLIEIDRELLVVNQFDPNTGIAVVPPWGRGARGSLASSHDGGSMVTVRPRFPRVVVANTLNEALGGMAPDLHGVVDLDPIDIDVIPDLAYPLPANCLKVLRIEAEVNTAYPSRHMIQNFRVNTKASGMELELAHRFLEPYLYQTLTVTIATQPGRLVNDDDDYAGVTGLPDSTSDIPVLGALARLVMSVESARLQVATVEANTRVDKVQPGSGTSLAKTYMALYQQRMQNEVAALQTRFPLVLRRVN